METPTKVTGLRAATPTLYVSPFECTMLIFVGGESLTRAQFHHGFLSDRRGSARFRDHRSYRRLGWFECAGHSRNRETDRCLRQHAPQSGNAPTSRDQGVAKITETDGQERLLAPVEAAQIGLVWRITRRKLSGNWASWMDIDPFEVPSDHGCDTTTSESGGSAFVWVKKIEDGTHHRPRRRIRVHTRGRWTHYRLVSQLRCDHARTTRRRGNADERAIIGIEREGGHPTGFPSRRLRRFHALRAENHQSSSFHRLPASAGRLLAGERDPWSNQSSGMASLLEGFPCGVLNVEGSARDASGPLSEKSRSWQLSGQQPGTLFVWPKTSAGSSTSIV